MTKPLFPDRLNGRPAGTPAESAEAVLQRLRLRAGAERAPSAFATTLARETKAETARTGVAASVPAERAPAQTSLDEMPLDMLEEQSGWRAHFPILAAIFVVSAIAGGTLAGLLLSARSPVSSQAENVVAMTTKSPATASHRSNETVLHPVRLAVDVDATNAGKAPAVASRNPAGATAVSNARSTTPQAPSAAITATGSAMNAASRIHKDEERITPLPAAPVNAEPSADAAGTARGSNAMQGAVTGRADTRMALAAVVGAAMANHPDRSAPDPQEEGSTAKTAKAAAPSGDATSATSTTRKGAMPAEPPVSMNAAGEKDMQALTENVVAALQDITRAGAAVTQRQTADLRSALAALVDRALSEGRSQEDVAQLLERALDETGGAAMPAALRGADGKVDLRLLLASIIPPEAVDSGNAGERGYIEALKREGAHTSLSPESAAGRFYQRNGKRYTRVRPGDTLSRIAFEAYGDVLAYPLILRANADRITSVRNLKPGMELLIPERDAAGLAGPIRLTPLPGTRKGTSIRRSGAGKKTGAKGGRSAARRKKAVRSRAARPRKAARVPVREQATPTAQRTVKTNFYSRFTAPEQAAAGASASQ